LGSKKKKRKKKGGEDGAIAVGVPRLDRKRLALRREGNSLGKNANNRGRFGVKKNLMGEIEKLPEKGETRNGRKWVRATVLRVARGPTRGLERGTRGRYLATGAFEKLIRSLTEPGHERPGENGREIEHPGLGYPEMSKGGGEGTPTEGGRMGVISSQIIALHLRQKKKKKKRKKKKKKKKKVMSWKKKKDVRSKGSSMSKRRVRNKSYCASESGLSTGMSDRVGRSRKRTVPLLNKGVQVRT